jgi:site-specific DNA recombinase
LTGGTLVTRAVLYARYSSDAQRAASIEDQVRLCRALAERQGWAVAEVFVDRAVSAASRHRPGYQAMLDQVRDGGVDLVLAESLDRLSRDQEDVAALFKRLGFWGVRLVTVAEGEIGDLHVGLKGAMNALYLKDLAQKTRRGLEGRVRAGRSAGGLCYGYAVVRELAADGPVRGKRAIVPAEAAVVRRIFTEFAGGRAPKAIARRLNAEGVPGPRGDLWRDGTIRGHRRRGTGILNNELYRKKVEQLQAALADTLTRDEALDLLRGLITKVTVQPGVGCVELVEGALTAMLALGNGTGAEAFASCSGGTVKVVAGAGFEPATFRL